MIDLKELATIFKKRAIIEDEHGKCIPTPFHGADISPSEACQNHTRYIKTIRHKATVNIPNIVLPLTD